MQALLVCPEIGPSLRDASSSHLSRNGPALKGAGSSHLSRNGPALEDASSSAAPENGPSLPDASSSYLTQESIIRCRCNCSPHLRKVLDASSSHCFGEWFFITRCKLFSLLLKLVPHYKMQVLLTTPENGPSLHAGCKLSPPLLRMVLHCQRQALPAAPENGSSLPEGSSAHLSLKSCSWYPFLCGICLHESCQRIERGFLARFGRQSYECHAVCHHRCCPHPASDGERQTLLLACAHFLCAPAILCEL